MRILVACEFSGAVRDAFRALGHDAWSCDLIEAEPSNSLGHLYHLQGDVRRILEGHIPPDMVAESAWRSTPLFRKWDMLVAFPPCTRLCNSGVRWLEPRNLWGEMREGAKLFRDLLECDIPRIAIENPIPHKYAIAEIGRSYDQIVQQWWFGHPETKATCLWLKNLPPLTATDIVEGRTPRVHYASPGPDRWKERSRTLPGFAAAMAEQWGQVQQEVAA